MVINETKQTVVGAVVFLSLLVMIGLSHGRGHKELSEDKTIYNITATFNRIDGLMIDSPVRLGGIRVGTVTAAKLDPYYRAVVTLAIEKDYKIPLDTSVAIHTDGLFGSKYINLDPGGSDEYLAEGGSLDYAQDAMILSELLDLIISQGTANLEKRKEAAKALKDAADILEGATEEPKQTPAPFGGGLLK